MLTVIRPGVTISSIDKAKARQILYFNLIAERHFLAKYDGEKIFEQERVGKTPEEEA